MDVTASVNNGTYAIMNVTANHTVIATFGINTYTVTGSVSAGSGSITPTSASVAHGSAVTFTIIPDSGYTLSGLTDNGVPVAAVENPSGTFTYTITNVTTDHAVSATFTQGSAAPVPAMGLWGFSAAVCGLIWIALQRGRRET
jgi:hypothetical protein